VIEISVAEPTIEIVHPIDSDVAVTVALENSIEEAVENAELARYVKIVGITDQETGAVLKDQRGNVLTARVPIIPPDILERTLSRRLRGWRGMTSNGLLIPFPDANERKANPKWWYVLGSPALAFHRDVPVKNDDGTQKLDAKDVPVILKHQRTAYSDYIFEKASSAGAEEAERSGEE
jgi:hypothetical protein